MSLWFWLKLTCSYGIQRDKRDSDQSLGLITVRQLLSSGHFNKLIVQEEQQVLSWSTISLRMFSRPLPIKTNRYLIYSRQSFEDLSRWLTDCRALASPHLVTVLVGNKLDKEEDREVEYLEGSRWAQENGQSLHLLNSQYSTGRRC